MIFELTDLILILPELIVVSAACLILLLDLFIPRGQKDLLAYFSLLSLGVAFWATYRMALLPLDYAFGGLFVLDPFASFFKILLYLSCAMTILISVRYLDEEGIHLGEYYAFILFATSGMMIMVSGADLITIFLGMELMSISLYILAGFKRHDKFSMEASAKYFVLGSFSSGILLFGISLLYGLTGSTQLHALGEVFASMAQGLPGSVLGGQAAVSLALILVVVGFGFKVAVVPFHMWIPDVYQGAPTSITAFMSVATKAASFAVLLRVLLEALGPVSEIWQVFLIGLSIATIVVGNVVAIVQSNIKRMLAYSSIAHAGYALIGVLVASELGIFSLMVYMVIYTFMTLGAFGVVILVGMSHHSSSGGEAATDEISHFSGLARSSPLAAFAMLVFMFSLTGIPPTAGFIGKLYVFMAAVEAQLVWLAVIGVIFSAVSAYYYLRVVMLMYMKEPLGPVTVVSSPAVKVALWVAVLVTLALGVYPAPLVDYAQSALLGFPGMF